MACTLHALPIQLDGMCDGSKLNILPVVLKPRWTLTSEDDFRGRTIEERLPYVRFCSQIPVHGGIMLLQTKGEEVHPVRVCHHGNVVADISSRGTQYASRSSNRNGASRLLPLLYSPENENRHQHSKAQGVGTRGFQDTAIINSERLLSLIENDAAFAAVRTCNYNNTGDNPCSNGHRKHSGNSGGAGPSLYSCSECNPGVNPRTLTTVTHVAMPNQIVKCSRLQYLDENKDCRGDAIAASYNKMAAMVKNKMVTDASSPRKSRSRYTNRTAVEQDYSNVISELRFRDGSLRMRHFKARKRYREQMDQVVNDFKSC